MIDCRLVGVINNAISSRASSSLVPPCAFEQEKCGAIAIGCRRSPMAIGPNGIRSLYWRRPSGDRRRGTATRARAHLSGENPTNRSRGFSPGCGLAAALFRTISRRETGAEPLSAARCRSRRVSRDYLLAG